MRAAAEQEKNEMFRFYSEGYLYLLLLIPLLAVVFEVCMARRRRTIARFATPKAIGRLAPESSPKRLRWKIWLLAVAMAMVVVALARPQMGAKLREVEREGVEIMLAVDVSNSMLADDFSPSRLERTKYAVGRMIEGFEEERVGVIVFAGDAYVQLPITSDYLTAQNFVEQISTTQVSKQGTNVAAAIELAVRSFSSQSEGSRVVILVTDGENHEADAMAAADYAAESGVTIYTVGMGTPEGAPIRIGDDFIRDQQGEIVVSKLDEQSLQRIAVTTGGAYVRASNASVGLEEIVSLVNKTEKAKFSAEIFEEYNELYAYPLWVALVLLLVEFVVLPRKNRWIARINLFGRHEGRE